MSIENTALVEAIYNGLNNDRSISDNMNLIISLCNTGMPHNDWSKLRRLPYDHLAGLASWLKDVLVHETPEIPLAGLWFGLFNPVYKKDPVSDIYVAGTSAFSIESADWACDPEYFPERGYAHSKILASIYRIAYSGVNGLGNNAEYPLCLAYGAFMVKRILSEIDHRLIRNSDQEVGIALGFDDGDYIILGKVTERGFIGWNPHYVLPGKA